jgi:geranylgeranyl pyrophosphate synthase
VIYQDEANAVFEAMEAMLAVRGAGSHYATLFGRAIHRARAKAEHGDFFLPLDVPFAVGDAIGRPRQEQIAAATVATLLWTGADLMDDYADGDLGEQWSGVTGNELALVWTNLLATLPHLHLAPHVNGTCLSRSIAELLWTMSEGQFTDLGSRSRIQTVSDYLTMVRKKTGAEVAWFASLPASIGNLPAAEVGAWTRFGEELGSMIQVVSDVLSTLDEGAGGDLRRGKRTLPVLHALSALPGGDAALFAEDLLAAEAGDLDAARRARATMNRCGATRAALSNAELLRYRAAAAIPIKLTTIAFEHPLRTLLRSFSV